MQIKGTESPITRIFGGKFRSTLRAPGQKDSVLVEDWRALRLDIQVCPSFLFFFFLNRISFVSCFSRSGLLFFFFFCFLFQDFCGLNVELISISPLPCSTTKSTRSKMPCRTSRIRRLYRLRYLAASRRKPKRPKSTNNNNPNKRKRSTRSRKRSTHNSKFSSKRFLRCWCSISRGFVMIKSLAGS